MGQQWLSWSKIQPAEISRCFLIIAAIATPLPPPPTTTTATTTTATTKQRFLWVGRRIGSVRLKSCSWVFEPNREKKEKRKGEEKKKKKKKERRRGKTKILSTNNTECFYIFPSPVVAVESLQLYVIPAASKEPLALRSIAPRLCLTCFLVVKGFRPSSN